MTDDTVAALVHKAAISDVIMRYFRGIDRMDLDLVRACYHPDATDHHGSFSGTVDEYLAWVEPLLRRYDSTFHFAGNVLVELDGNDGARAETYGIAVHRAAGGADHHNLTTGFRFVDDFERRAGEWRIAARVAVTEWSRVEREQDWWPVPDGFVRGARDRSDPVYRPR